MKQPKTCRLNFIGDLSERTIRQMCRDCEIDVHAVTVINAMTYLELSYSDEQQIFRLGKSIGMRIFTPWYFRIFKGVK